MTTAPRLAALTALLALGAVEAPAQETTAEAPSQAPAVAATAETVVATVEGVEITLGHLIAMRARLPEEYAQLPPDVLFNGILDQIIQQTAVTDGLQGTLSHGAELALENERRSFLAGEAISRATEGAVSEEAVAALYTERFTNAEPELEFNAAHILVATREEAEAIKAELDAGGDFAAIAREKSQDPGSGQGGGDLGWFAKGMMVEQFEAAVLAMEAGQVSEPIETQFGWHIIRLAETRAKEPPALDAVRVELEEELRRGAIEALVDAKLAAAEVSRSVEGIDPALINDLSLIAE